MKSDTTIFYYTERAIKTYRRYAQAQLKTRVVDITIDQLLVLSKLKEDPEMLHSALADYVFKDLASISRMLTLLEKNGYITRTIDAENRRRFTTIVTKKGKKVLADTSDIVLENRRKALDGISDQDIQTCMAVLLKISDNITN